MLPQSVHKDRHWVYWAAQLRTVSSASYIVSHSKGLPHAAADSNQLPLAALVIEQNDKKITKIKNKGKTKRNKKQEARIIKYGSSIIQNKQ